ncbi:MAG: 4-hydroxy-tetrahydrodipicolinate reductase [Candidatus Acidiferrales bacterium]
MNLAIVGYGKMGQLIEQLAPSYGFTAALKLNRENNGNFEAMTPERFRGIDVAMEFSSPASAVGNMERLAGLGVNVVAGTTGWHDQLDRVRRVVNNSGTGMVWSPSYSLGMNAFTQIVSLAARLLANESDYGAWGWEMHHTTKKDALSGTLLKLVDEMKRSGYARPVSTSSNRVGTHPGAHEIGFDSPADTITLRHTARNREGYARGALRAAKWIAGKKGFFEFPEIISELG